ncbi:MAG: hypothetical protein ACM32E_10360 [Gemmatimonadota bacterium]
MPMNRSDLAIFIDVFTASVLVFLGLVAWTLYDMRRRRVGK